MATVQAFSQTTKDAAAYLCQQSQRTSARTLREFAEAEIIVPDGEYEGQPFRVSRQPYVGLLYDCIDSGQWNDFVITGPSQSGKTLCAFVIPTIYHALELRERSIVGLPDADMSADKWSVDLKPVIEKSGFAHLLPSTGSGSRGGRKVDSVDFLNGSKIRFLTGGGGDKSRAGYTARVLLVTETDGMDESGAASRESDKIAQLQARQRSWPRRRRRTYKECTVSTSTGRTWREYENESTNSRIVCPCVHCEEFVQVEREHLVGWKEATTIGEAQRLATFVCPNCSESITTDEQRTMNENAKLLHGGQTIDKRGKISGPMPDTARLGFRWSAFNNLFLSAEDHAADEWSAAQYGENTEERLNREKELRQFVWCIPADADQEELIELSVPELMNRTGREDETGTARGVIPAGHDFLTAGVDIRSRQIHYVIKSSDSVANVRVVQYGILKVHSQRLGQEAAILRALQYFRDNICRLGFRPEDGGQARAPDLVFIDSNWQPDPVYTFANESEALGWSGLDDFGTFWPIVGRGYGKQYDKAYSHPANVSADVKLLGPGQHVRVNRRQERLYIILDADRQKAWTHARWATPLTRSEDGGEYSEGAATIHVPDESDHQYFFKQITAEKEVETFEEGKGTTRRWIVSSRVNHYLDADSYSNAALRLLGVEPTQTAEVDTVADLPPVDDGGGMTTPGSNRPFFE